MVVESCDSSHGWCAASLDAASRQHVPAVIGIVDSRMNSGLGCFTEHGSILRCDMSIVT